MSQSARLNAENNYSLKLFAGNINDIINETYYDYIECDRNDSDYAVDDKVFEISEKIHNKYGSQERHVSWEHLHPDLDYELYEMVASECADKKAEDTVWFGDSIISEGV